MTTDQLIASLSDKVSRVSPHALNARLVSGLAAGALVAMVAVIVVLGVRPDLQLAMRGFAFWMKSTYTISLGLGAMYAVSRLAQPVPRSIRGLWLLSIPVLVLAGIGVGELAGTPSGEWLAMWLSQSWKVCPWLVLALAVPIFIGLLWSFRKLAPTRLRAAGAAAGLAAGAWAGTIYCLHCAEVAAIFVLTWYSLGILLAAAVGALVGPRFIRW
ncbi:MAG TPA: DUF1109 domain-containing protein [Steroidobacteraceae bacterium]|nr:DUF1109 domain-containing protein [Steroidobacteraceae bacterium]